MSGTSIGLPKLKIAFEAAARQTINRSKKGYAAVFVRDAKAQGLHRLSSDTMIPSELGEANRSYIKTAFVGSDRGQPSLVYLVVIPTGTEDTSALEGGLKLLESVSVDYLAAPADATEGELTTLNQWVAGQRARYRTVKLVQPFGSKGSDSMGVIELDESGMTDAAGAVTAGTACGRLAGVLNPGESYCEIDYDRQLNWLKAQGVEVSTLTRQQVLEYQTGSWVFIRCGGRLVDAMEDFEVLFNAQTLALAV